MSIVFISDSSKHVADAHSHHSGIKTMGIAIFALGIQFKSHIFRRHPFHAATHIESDAVNPTALFSITIAEIIPARYMQEDTPADVTPNPR